MRQSFVWSIGILALAAVAGSATSAENKCRAAKVKAVAQTIAARAKCLSKGLAKAEYPDPACLGRAEMQLVDRFAKADAKSGCPTRDDLPIIESNVDSLINNNFVGQVNDPPHGGDCDAAKVKAAGRNAKAKLACHARAIGKARAVDPACLARADDVFEGRVAAAEAQFTADCTTLGDAAGYEASIDVFVRHFVTSLAPPTTTTTTTLPGGLCANDQYPTCGGTCPAGFVCLPLDLVQGDVSATRCQCIALGEMCGGALGPELCDYIGPPCSVLVEQYLVTLGGTCPSGQICLVDFTGSGCRTGPPPPGPACQVVASAACP